MGEKLVIGPYNGGLRTDRTPFVIDNDSFPQLVNAYQWRGRVKRKRGTAPLGRLQRQITTTITLTLNTGQDAILPNFPIVPGTINFTGSVDGTTYTDPNKNSILTATGGTGTGGTINYATGDIHINAGGGENLTGTFSYYPSLPVMGLEDLTLTSTQFPGTIGFDTEFSYNIDTTEPYPITDVSFYKNPAADPVLLPGYIPKNHVTPITWNGETYQQFWSTNYLGAFWATNGIEVPFSNTNVGMQFNTVSDVAITVNGPPAKAIIVTAQPHNLVVGDFVFINEVQGITGINLQTGYVIASSDNTHITVEFPKATLGGGGYTGGGIVQYLTNRLSTSVDCMRWYDGSPNSTGATPQTGPGWVNFCPPLSLNPVSIAGLAVKQYYLVTAKMVVPFKDYLLFFGPVIQTNAEASQVYLNDVVIFSQNGTPFYTCSFTDTTSNYGINPTIPYQSVLTPGIQTAAPFAFFSDITGYGGYQSAGVDQPLTTVGVNEDALICGFATLSARLIFTGNNLFPFNFYIINAELGSSSTFSTIIMDEGVLTRGTRGFIMTNQVSSKRFDLDILETTFDNISLNNNGNERFCSQRDFINEWIYFTYYASYDDISGTYNFPTQTLQYNYRDQSWGIFNESYTTYGQFKPAVGYTWLTIPWTWENWNQPWDEGTAQVLQPLVIAGNQQGFVVIRDEATQETPSLFISAISGNTITSPDHCLNNGDYIFITGCLGTITNLNNIIFQVNVSDENDFTVNPPIGSGTYTGGGLITRLYIPFIQSKQFPTNWQLGRKTRLGMQQYLLTYTPNSQVTLQIYLSQDSGFPFNVPPSSFQDDTIYSTVLYTCPESTNLGLTPANVNLQMPQNNNQEQIWHRINTSLIGDTVQFAITLNDAQMRTVDASGNPLYAFAEVELHAAILDLNPSQLLA